MKKISSMFLALCMVLTLLPVSAMAEEAPATIDTRGEIIAFAPLGETEKTVSPDTSIEDLELPEILTATVRAAVRPEEEPVQDSDSQYEDTVTGNSGITTAAAATYAEWEDTTVDIPVTWTSQPEYDMDTADVYVFTPVLDDYTVSAGLAGLPQIAVTVDAAAPMTCTLLGSSGSTVIEVNNSAEIGNYIASATGNLELKLISSGFATAYVMTTIPEDIGYDITIDLNGQTMANEHSGTENVIRKIGNGRLTIKDSSGGSGKITRTIGSGPAILNESTGEIIFEGGYIDSEYASAIVSNNGPVTFKGGRIANTAGIGIQCDNSTVTIEDGNINSTGNSKTTISANIINVSGGMVQNGSYQGSTLVGNTISVSGGTVKTGTPDGYAIKGNDGATITLTGGTTQNISYADTGVAINPGTMGTIRIPSGTVTVIGDGMAMLQVPDLSGYSNVVISGNTSSADDTYLVEIPIVALEAELDQYKYLLFEPVTGLPKEPMPEATFTATGTGEGTLSGLTAGLKCYIEGRGWHPIDSDANINLSNLEPCSILLVRKGNGTTTADSDQQTITITKAEKPNLTPTQPSTIGGSGSIPMTSAHEYCTYHNSTWIQASGTTTLGPGNYRVRVKAAGTMLASEIQSITLTAFTGTKETTPEATFAANGPYYGTLSGVTGAMKYRIDGGAWTDISSAADINLSGLSACTISVVKKGDGITKADSDPQTITVTRAATPTLTATQPGVIGGSGSIPMTAAHEYSADGGSWSNASGATTLAAGTYQVRVRASGTMLASEIQNITLIAFTGTKETTPSVTFSAIGPDTGTLSGVAGAMKYRIDGGAWVDISSGADINLSGLSACTISVVKNGDGITTTDSDAQTITVTRAAAPTLTATQPGVIGGSGSIPMTAAHEYSTDGGSWSNASGATTLAAGTYQVRVRASGTMLASGNQSITLIAFTGTRESTPAANVDYTAEKLTGLTANGSYLAGSAAITADAGGEIDIDNSWFGTAISLIKIGNGTTTTDSTAQSISLAARPAAPSCTVTQPSASSAAGTISGIGTAMEYSTNGGTDWTIGTDTDIAGLSPGTVLIRMKATADAPAGLSQSITITAYLPNALTGTATISNTAPRIGDRLTGSLVGGNNTGALTYVWKALGTQAGIGSEYIVDAADYGKMITLEITSSVETGTRTSTATAAVAKRAAPASPLAPTLSSKTHNSVSLTANAAYEFSRDGITWQTSNVFSELTASMAYTFYQRVAETADTESSTASAGLSVTTNSDGDGGGSGSGSGGDSGSGGSSSNDNSSSVIVTPPAPDKPNSPTQGEIKVPGTVDGKGNITVSITDKTVTNAFDKAHEDAKKRGNEQNGITVVLRVDTGSKTGSNATVNLPKTVQNTIIEKKIVNTIVVVVNPDIRIGMDLATVKEINNQAKSDVNITATRADSGKLTGDAEKAIGGRPVFDLKVNYGSGKQVQSFGAGSVSVTIPYTLGVNEKAGNVQAVYVDDKGKVNWLANSFYDSVEKVLRFNTDHFSTYGIGYKQIDAAFTDIAGHWAKEDIEFVVTRGLFSGTSAFTFSPNTSMTRGMFVTALGRLANADVSGYKKSSFTDVKDDAYHMSYIEWASKNSIVNGTGNGKFAPDQSITREQMAVIMQNYAKVSGFALPKVHTENTFADNTKISAYTKEAVKQMQMAGVISGKNGNLFDPQDTATRAEVSAVLRRFVELRGGGLRVPKM